MSTTTPVLAPVYTCKICRRSMQGGVPIIGEKPQDRMARLGQILAGHMGKEHQELLGQCILAGNMFAGWMIGEQFAHNDPDLSAEAKKVRLKLRQLTQRLKVPDSMIETQVNGRLKAADSSTRLEVIQMLKELRDELEEIKKG